MTSHPIFRSPILYYKCKTIYTSPLIKDGKYGTHLLTTPNDVLVLFDDSDYLWLFAKVNRTKDLQRSISLVFSIYYFRFGTQGALNTLT